MKRLTTLCIVMMFGACSVAMAQNTTETKTAITKESKPVTNIDVPVSAQQAAAAQEEAAKQTGSLKPQDLSKQQASETQKTSEKRQTETQLMNTADQRPVKQSDVAVPQKLGEHGPAINDPDYDAKKAEWIKNYPQEYNPAPKADTGKK